MTMGFGSREDYDDSHTNGSERAKLEQIAKNMKASQEEKRLKWLSDREESMQLLISLAKKNGLKRMSIEGYVEFEFWDRPDVVMRINAEEAKEEENKKSVPITGEEEMPADEQMLYYSTDHFDEIEQELKDAKAKDTVPW